MQARPSELIRLRRSPAAFCKFDVEDPLGWQKSLTDEEQAISETARSFCQETLQPKVLEMWRKESWDPTILTSLGELGLLGPTINGYGCAGVSNVAYGLITRELERVDSGFRSMMSVQSSLAMGAINQFGSEAQKEKYLPRMAKGELVGCFGLTEPNHGSDPAGMETVAEDKGDGTFVLNGSKTWISSSPYADVCVIWARCKWDDKVRGFLVDKGTKGLSCPPIKNKIQLRASVTGSIFLEDVVVKRDESLLPLARPGLGSPFECLNSARYGIAWGALGALESCITESTQYALDRKQFKKPLAAFQLVQKKIVDAHTEAALGFAGCMLLGRAKDNKGEWCPQQVSMLKRNSTRKALEHARILQEILGGNCSADEYGLNRHVANLGVVNTYEGTSDIHALILGQAITGHQAFF
ncbi:acyl-CoA dehydrogenase domain-containing protein [Jaminaea rosea]|uniref:Acyl-CoA dehydrogenase domain-containing protein n=1 Tax=Jaminaea rosea TaxID=1569628 RepID=A0A316UUN4_9BASI|nr:acyl-CoA dehydrogenase domain-containing protein [Jaminaea rosea]PWN29017.1 acyl-CoA dehydrogenase domain-containing protein [Jaminaea rosea]